MPDAVQDGRQLMDRKPPHRRSSGYVSHVWAFQRDGEWVTETFADPMDEWETIRKHPEAIRLMPQAAK